MFFRFNPFLRRARDVRLPSSEKAALRAGLASFIQANPASVRVAVPVRRLPRRSTHALVAVCAMLILVLMGAGTVSAAEQSLPTDPLYPIKIYVTEPLKRSLARTPEAKAQVDAELALRRLDEVNSLAKKGELTSNEQTRAETRFVQQTKRVEMQLKALRATGKEDRASEVVDRLETEVGVRAATVEIEATATTTRHVESLVPVLKRAKETAKELRQERREERRKERREENDKDAREREDGRRDRSSQTSDDRSDEQRSRRSRESSN